MTEIKLLKTERSSMAKKWEDDMIDTLQENTNLLNNYKRRISELETKLRSEIRNNKAGELQSVDTFE